MGSSWIQSELLVQAGHWQSSGAACNSLASPKHTRLKQTSNLFACRCACAVAGMIDTWASQSLHLAYENYNSMPTAWHANAATTLKERESF